MRILQTGRARWALLLIGGLLGMVLLSPVAAHVTNDFGHLWNDHIKPKADARYVRGDKAPWALVDGTGEVSIKSDQGANSVRRGSGLDGEYQVYFARNIRSCAIVVTARLPYLARARPFSNHYVEVTLLDQGEPRDSDFSIVVRC